MEKETYWSRFADDFEERNNYVAGADNIDAIRKALRECAVTGDVLELGCGNGTYSKVLSETADQVLATDYSDEMVAASETRLRSFQNIHVEEQNCLDIAQPDNRFDCVVMVNLLHVISTPQRAIRESRRVLKDGGELIVVSFTMEGISFIQKLGMMYRYLKTYGKPPKTARKLTVATTQSLLEDNGFLVSSARLIGTNSKAVFAQATRA